VGGRCGNRGTSGFRIHIRRRRLIHWHRRPLSSGGSRPGAHRPSAQGPAIVTANLNLMTRVAPSVATRWRARNTGTILPVVAGRRGLDNGKLPISPAQDNKPVAGSLFADQLT
jgi:hypothetical protein